MPFGERSHFNRMPCGIAFAVLSTALLAIPAAPVCAQNSDAHSDGTRRDTTLCLVRQTAMECRRRTTSL
jgi:hypothetical protein